MNLNDQRYYRARAEAEIEAAAKSENPGACHAHYAMAEAYLEKVYPPTAANDGEALDAVND